ncbi:MAG: hypothetical protein U1E59_08125 [Amaricoccus sp.]
MPIPDPRELPSDADWLGDYRAAVDRLSEETADEFGGQPMPPEAFSMLATLVAALQLSALMLPWVPFEPATWEVGLALALVWAAAFRFQVDRYARFEERLDRKVLAHARSAVRVPADRRFRRRR